MPPIAKPRSDDRKRPYRNPFLRKLVYERDGGVCALCGKYDAKWERDHIVPLWEHGQDNLDNSQTLCRSCHLRKSVGETPIRAKTDRLRARHDLTERRRKIAARTATS